MCVLNAWRVLGHLRDYRAMGYGWRMSFWLARRTINR